MPLIIMEEKVDECVREIATRVVAEMSRLYEFTEGRDSVFGQALKESLPRVRVKLRRWCEQVLNRHPAIKLDEMLNSATSPLVLTTTAAGAPLPTSADASKFHLMEWTKEDVDNLFIAGKDYSLPVTAEYAIPLGTTPLVNKLFGLILAGIGKYLQPVGNYQPADVERIYAVFEAVLDQVKQQFGICDENLLPAGEALL
jgi:hypothetical protein